jgi:hypothetical protein
MRDDHGYPPMTTEERALFARVGTPKATDDDLIAAANTRQITPYVVCRRTACRRSTGFLTTPTTRTPARTVAGRFYWS